MSLDALIHHARRTSAPHEPLPEASMRHWVDARATDGRLYLRYRGESGPVRDHTFAAFAAAVRRCAAGLQAFGLKPGDRMASAAPNHDHTAIHYFAAWYLGVVVVPLNLGEDDDRLRYILAQGVKRVFALPAHEARIRALAPHIPLHTHLPESDAEVTGPPPDLGTEALVVYTSGTTGHPKGVRLDQGNLLEDARAIADWHGIGPGTRMACVLPIHHVNGTVVTLITPFRAGASVVLHHKFHASGFFAHMREDGVHIVSVVPTLLQFLLHAHGQGTAPDTGTLRHLICGAGPLTVHLAQAFEERFGLRVVHGYGLSETTCYSCFLPVGLSDGEHAAWMRDHGWPSIGVAIPPNEMAIHDADGRPLPDGERGEIVIRGHNVMMGYAANEDANRKAFTYGWFRSGDEGFALTGSDGRRYYFITGRIKELIIRGGVNLAPLEIDEVINRAPGVQAGIAVGFANDWYGEEVGAYVKPLPGTTPDADAVLAFCREHLPWAKCPKVVVFADELPVTSTGKYQRMKVAHVFDTWKSHQFRA